MQNHFTSVFSVSSLSVNTPQDEKSPFVTSFVRSTFQEVRTKACSSKITPL